MSKSNQEVLDELAARLRAQQAPQRNSANGHARGARPAKPAVPDETVIEKCRGAENSAKFSDLFDAGDVHAYHKGDDSVADLALLGLLTFWTQDEAQLERLFTGSALGRREKWRKRADYRRRTIAKALSEATEVYDWERNGLGRSFSSSSRTLIGGDDDENNETPEIVWFSELGEPQEREYLVERVGAKSNPVVAFGAGGVAKSFAMLAAGIAIAGTGEERLGLKVLEHGYVLYLDFELDAAEQHRRVRERFHDRDGRRSGLCGRASVVRRGGGVSFHIGLDLGQAADFTALAVLEAVSAKETELKLHLRHLERYPLRTAYTTVAANVMALMARLASLELAPFGGVQHDLLVDNTGVGRAVTDVLREKGLLFKAITLTGGSQVTRGDAGEYRVPKADVVDALVVPFQAERLKVASGLALWTALRTELLNFRRKINPATAHASYEHWRETDHDDLVLAAALAAWGAARFPATTPPPPPTRRPSYWSGAQR